MGEACSKCFHNLQGIEETAFKVSQINPKFNFISHLYRDVMAWFVFINEQVMLSFVCSITTQRTAFSLIPNNKY